MRARRPHTLAPLTKITSSKAKFKWTKIEQDAFDEIMRIVARDILLDYPEFNEKFKIHNNDSDFQIGRFIIQKGKPITFYSRKITDPQKRYTLTEKDLLSIF